MTQFKKTSQPMSLQQTSRRLGRAATMHSRYMKLRPLSLLLGHQGRCNPAKQPACLGGSGAFRFLSTDKIRVPRCSSRPTAVSSDRTPNGVETSKLWLIVGLGNPGPNYMNTRHNVGFALVDLLAQSEGIDMKKLEKNAAVGHGSINGQKVILAKPMTFMNNSGESVGGLCRFYKIPMAQVIVISDDLDLPSGTLRLREKGGHGGHNGLRSIMQHFQGSQDFPRLKIGIGRPSGQQSVAGYVLQPFSKAEAAEMDVALQEGVLAVRSVLELGLQKAVSGSRILTNSGVA